MSESPSWQFETSVEWNNEHLGTVRAENRPDIDISCPPVFCESPGDRWTPEDFYIASVEMCFMLTLKLFCERVDVAFESYKSRAVGTLEVVNKKICVTRIDIYPEIRVADEHTLNKVQRLVKGSNRNCLVTESIKTEVSLHPKYYVGKEVEAQT